VSDSDPFAWINHAHPYVELPYHKGEFPQGVEQYQRYLCRYPYVGPRPPGAPWAPGPWECELGAESGDGDVTEMDSEDEEAAIDRVAEWYKRELIRMKGSKTHFVWSSRPRGT
jgi:hypothetical protein